MRVIPEPLKLSKSIMENVNSQSKVAFISTIIVGLINYSYFITHHVESPDAVSIGHYHMSDSWELSLGRFGLRIIDELRGGIVNENLLIISSIILIGIASGFLVSTLNIRDNLIAALISALFISSPHLADSYMFIYCADSYSFSILFSILSVWFLKKKTYMGYILAMLMLAASASLYQAYIGITLALCLILIIFELLLNTEVKKAFQTLIQYMFTMLGGLLIYYGIEQMVLNFKNVAWSSYKGASDFGINSIVSQMTKSIPQTYKDFYQYLFSDNILQNDYWKRKIIHILLISVILFILGILISQIKRTWSKVLVILLCLMLPLAINVMDLIAPTTNIYLMTGTPLLCIYFFCFGLYGYLREAKNFYICLKYSIVFLNIWLIATFINSNSASFKCREEVYSHFYATHANIINRVEALPEYNTELKWCFNDIVRYQSPLTPMSNGFIAYDNEVWNAYGGLRVTQAFYEQYYGKTIQLCSWEEYNSIVEGNEFANMATFPNDGSIKIVDGIVVIKLNDFRFEQE